METNELRQPRRGMGGDPKNSKGGEGVLLEGKEMERNAK